MFRKGRRPNGALRDLKRTTGETGAGGMRVFTAGFSGARGRARVAFRAASAKCAVFGSSAQELAAGFPPNRLGAPNRCRFLVIFAISAPTSCEA